MKLQILHSTQVQCTTDLSTMYNRLKYNVQPTQVQCTTDSSTMYNRLKYNVHSTQIKCTHYTRITIVYFQNVVRAVHSTQE